MPLQRLQQYPPIPGPSDRQEYRMLMEGEHIDAYKFTGVAFPASYIEKYGIAILYYRAFERLMRCEPDRAVLPKYKIDFAQLAQTISFVQFARQSDRIAQQKGVRPLSRSELEAGWVQELFFKYDSMVVDVAAAQEKYGKEDEEKFWSWAKHWLKEAVEKRFTSDGIEEYWVAKKIEFPELDVERLDDNFGEPVEAESENESECEVAGSLSEVVDTDADMMMDTNENKMSSPVFYSRG